MDFSRRSLVFGAGALGLLGPAARARAGGARRVVVVLANGGWDVSFCMDPKEGSEEIDGPELDEEADDPDDREALQTFSGIPIMTNAVKRPAVTTFFERWGSQTVVHNGIHVGSIVHDFCRYHMLTGTGSPLNPDFAAITGAVHGADRPLGSVDTSGLSLSGPLAATTGRVGARGQLTMLLDPVGSTLQAPAFTGNSYPGFVPDASEQALLETFLAGRAEVMERSSGGHPNSAAKFAALAESASRAERLREDTDLVVGDIVLGAQPTLSDTIDLTVGLLARDTCRAITLDSGSIWDTHTKNSLQHGNYQQMFTALNGLLDGLSAEGLLSDTLVVVVSEMTRTPRMNADLGKDHWPHTSALLIGAGVSGGRVVGATTETLESLPVDFATGLATPNGSLCKHDNFVAGVLKMLEIDPGEWLPGVEPFLGATV